MPSFDSAEQPLIKNAGNGNLKVVEKEPWFHLNFTTIKRTSVNPKGLNSSRFSLMEPRIIFKWKAHAMAITH